MSRGTDQAWPRCLPTQHLCHWLRGAFDDAVGSLHRVNEERCQESGILMLPAQIEAPGCFTALGSLLKTKAALPNSK